MMWLLAPRGGLRKAQGVATRHGGYCKEPQSRTQSARHDDFKNRVGNDE